MSRPRSYVSTIMRRAFSYSSGMRKRPRVCRRLDAEMPKRERCQVGDAPRRGGEADRKQRNLGVRRSKGAVAAAA